ELDLSNAGMVSDQPQNTDLFLGQIQIGEGLGEMAIDRAMRQTKVKADDVVQPGEFRSIIVRRQCGLAGSHPNPSPNASCAFVSRAYNLPQGERIDERVSRQSEFHRVQHTVADRSR